MDVEEYDRIYELELDHWRYRAIRRTLLSVLRRHVRRTGTTPRRILDAGCGPGGTTQALATLAPTIGVDVHPRALALARRRSAVPLVRASVSRLPFADASFDAVVSVDVLYHREVEDDAEALAEFARVCRPGGAVLLWLPAYDWMRSSHDAVVHTARRYSRRRLRELADGAGLSVEFVTYLHAPILLAALLRMGLERLRGARRRSSLGAPPRLLNLTLACVLAVETRLALRAPLPFGLSLLALLRR